LAHVNNQQNKCLQLKIDEEQLKRKEWQVSYSGGLRCLATEFMLRLLNSNYIDCNENLSPSQTDGKYQTIIARKFGSLVQLICNSRDETLNKIFDTHILYYPIQLQNEEPELVYWACLRNFRNQHYSKGNLCAATARMRPQTTTPMVLQQDSSACNASVYTLNTIEYRDDDSSDRSYLLSPETPTYGATIPRSPCLPNSARIIFNATLKMAAIFIISTIFLGGLLWLALPTLET